MVYEANPFGREGIPTQDAGFVGTNEPTHATKKEISMIDFSALKAPFPPDKVSWRIGRVSKDGKKASALAYLDARDVMNRLDDVCGPANWQCKYSHATVKTVCDIGVNIADVGDDGQWVWKADGAGDSDIEAEKGALSDAFKRAAVRWGIGRYLYDIPSAWVQINEFKQITDVEMERLARLLPNAAPGLTVHGPTGLSKKPAKFWENDNLLFPIPTKYQGNTEASTLWLIEQFKIAIDKAPTRDLLAKLQTDNASWIDKLPATKTHELYEACSIRATQFDGAAA